MGGTYYARRIGSAGIEVMVRGGSCLREMGIRVSSAIEGHTALQELFRAENGRKEKTGKSGGGE